MPLIRDIVSGRAPRPKRNKRALVCVDYANWAQSLGALNKRMAWAGFKDLMEDMFSYAMLFYYYGSITRDYWNCRHSGDSEKDFQAAQLARDSFFKNLKSLGYTVRTKPIAMISRGRIGREPKCNFDVEIAIDVMDNLNNFDVFVLGSGDGDFVPLLKRVKRERKQTYVISGERQFNSKLKKTTKEWEYLNNLIQLVPDLTE